MNYFQYNEQKGRKAPKRTEHGAEIVDIPGMLVTEQWDYTDRHAWTCPCIECRIDRAEDTL